MNGNKTLIIWLLNGNTCKFEQVDQFNVNPSENRIEFTYFGVSTQVKREASFLKKNIAGYALEV